MINLCVGGCERAGLICVRILRIGGRAMMYRAMMYKVYAAFIMSLSVALTVASNQALGGSGAVHGAVSASTHSPFHPSVTRSPNHHNGRNRGIFFPAAEGFFWDPSNGEPNVDVTPPISGPTSGDINYTYKYDVPWDWAHRYPPSFFASPPKPPSPPVAYVPGCPAQTVTVPGEDGKDQTVSIVRC
jgi:hypothetical protein